MLPYVIIVCVSPPKISGGAYSKSLVASVLHSYRILCDCSVLDLGGILPP